MVSYRSVCRLRSLNRTGVKNLSSAYLLLVSLINAGYARKSIIKITNKKIHLYTIKTKGMKVIHETLKTKPEVQKL